MDIVAGLLVSLVTTNSLGSIKIAVHAGISLVQGVALVGSSSVGGRARSGTDVGSTMSTRSSTVITVGVNAGVGSIGYLAVVGAMLAFTGVVGTVALRASHG